MKGIRTLIIAGLMIMSAVTIVMAEDMMAGNASAMSKMMIYSADAFEGAQSAKRVLFFHASWCPSCVASANAIDMLDIPGDVKVFKVDYDSFADLKKKYGVSRQDTFIQVDQDGNKVKEWSGNAKNLLGQLK